MIAPLALGLLFVVAAAAVWAAGIRLTDATDVLARRFGLGEALGGMILLAITTDLPEIGIVVSGSYRGDFGIVTGNLLGGIAMQTAVLVVLDYASSRRARPPLSNLVASLVPALEGVFVIVLLLMALLATQLPSSSAVARIDPGALSIAIVWCAGLVALQKVRKRRTWQRIADDATVRARQERRPRRPKMTTRPAVALFAGAAIVTLVGGTALELTSQDLASTFGLSGSVFGATVLAAATALPELSTGLRSIVIDDYELAVSDIFGGNAFLPVLFLLAGAVAGRAVLPAARPSDIFIAALGILLTSVYIGGLVVRPKRRTLHLGVDSLAIAAVFVCGIAVLAFI